MRKSIKGFTLIELIVVIAVLAILAGLLIPQISSFINDARISRLETELRSFKGGISRLFANVGYYPTDVGPNTDPGLNNIAVVPAAYQPKWKGPYMDRWPEAGHPWGGQYDYEYWSSADFNYNGTAGDEVIISVRQNLTTEYLDRIDEDLDDGVANAGTTRYSGDGDTSWLGYYVGEGPSW